MILGLCKFRCKTGVWKHLTGGTYQFYFFSRQMIDYANNHVQEQDLLEARHILTSNIRRTGMFVIWMSQHLHDAVF